MSDKPDFQHICVKLTLQNICQYVTCPGGTSPQWKGSELYHTSPCMLNSTWPHVSAAKQTCNICKATYGRRWQHMDYMLQGMYALLVPHSAQSHGKPTAAAALAFRLLRLYCGRTARTQNDVNALALYCAEPQANMNTCMHQAFSPCQCKCSRCQRQVP